jgi:hypothetical protein
MMISLKCEYIQQLDRSKIEWKMMLWWER